MYVAAKTTSKRKQVRAVKQKHLNQVKEEKDFLARKMTLAISDLTMYHFTATDKMSPFKLLHFRTLLVIHIGLSIVIVLH